MKEAPQRFAALLGSLCQLYHTQLTPAGIELYWQILSAYDFQRIRWACRQHVEDTERGRYFPKPADILRWLKPDRQTRSYQAWQQCFQAIARYGAYQGVIFDDACLHATVRDLGGWVFFCRQTERDLAFLRPQFLQTYRDYLAHPPEGKLPALGGLVPSQSIRIGAETLPEEVSYDG